MAERAGDSWYAVAVEPERTDDPYELAPPSQPKRARPPRARPPTQEQQPPRGPQAPGTPQPLDYRGNKRTEDRAGKPLDYRPAERADDAETIRNLYMPLGFLLGGLAIELGAAYLFPVFTPTLADAAVHVTIVLVGRTMLLMVAMLIAARLRAIDLGPLPLALLKLAALAVAPSAVLILASPLLWIVPFGCYILPVRLLLGLAILLVVVYTLLGAFFDLDEGDTRYCLMVMFIVWVTAHFGLMALEAYW